MIAETRGSFWRMTQGKRPLNAPLFGQINTDTVVVGAGMTGLTTALLLQRSGRDVVLLEASTLGAGSSGGTSAHVTEILDESYEKILDNFGETNARYVAHGYRDALDFISQIAETNSAVDFSYVSAYRYTENPDDLLDLERECDAANVCGVQARLTDKVPLKGAKYGIHYPMQAKFNPVIYLETLADEFISLGGRFYEHSRVKAWDEKIGDGVVVNTDSGTIYAQDLVLATHSPLGFHLLQTELGAYESYVMAFALEESFPDALFWDDLDPYHYMRKFSHNGTDYLLLGGEDHKTGHEKHPEVRYEKLEAFARDRFLLGPVAWKWEDEFFEPADGLPYVGLSAFHKKVFVATGYSGVGITGATLAAHILKCEITGQRHSCAEALSAKRVKPIASARKFVKENADAMSCWLSGRVSGSNVTSLSDIEPNSGAVVKHEGQNVAVFRDEQGHIHAHSAVCTHMGCIVNWNNSEKTWDCPCHGGRFHADGEVLCGPPVDALPSVEIIPTKQPERVQQHDPIFGFMNSEIMPTPLA